MKRKAMMLSMVVGCLFGLISLSFGTPCEFTIDKMADQTELTLSPGQQFIVNYQVIVNVVDPTMCTAGFNMAVLGDSNLIDPQNPCGYMGVVFYGSDPLPKTFTYSKIIGPYNDCGFYGRVDNTALFIDSPSGCEPIGPSASWTVLVNVPCQGCTLTPGYWKTHSKYGPAPYDNTWASIGEDTLFFSSGHTWYEVLWTPPSGGNAYYILAHAYIAAYLNGLNGAESPSDVNTKLAHAQSLLSAYAPTSRLSRAVRTDFINTASVLDQYNNGYIGPGHCSE